MQDFVAMGRVEVALEEYKTLRGEILGRQQAQTTLVSIALTATAAVGAIAFATEAQSRDRLEILLVLPVVLCGLGLAYLSHSHGCHLIGQYINHKLWPELQRSATEAGSIPLPSWEQSIQKSRKPVPALVKPGGYLSWVPGFFIFGVPSIAALVLNRQKAPDWDVLPWDSEGGALSTAWSIDAIALVLAFLLMVSVAIAAWAGGESLANGTAAGEQRPPTAPT
jgi:hypothetical protein